MQEVKLFHRGADGAAADLFDNTYAMIGIDDFVADVEVQVTITHMDIQDGDGAGESPLSTTFMLLPQHDESKIKRKVLFLRQGKVC